VILVGWLAAARAQDCATPFSEFVEHWSTPEFADYVAALGELAAPDTHEDLVGDVLALEVAFWDMALSAD